jgi:hypothetical protein
MLKGGKQQEGRQLHGVHLRNALSLSRKYDYGDEITDEEIGACFIRANITSALM